jgi:hypothetical protein
MPGRRIAPSHYFAKKMVRITFEKEIVVAHIFQMHHVGRNLLTRIHHHDIYATRARLPDNLPPVGSDANNN